MDTDTTPTLTTDSALTFLRGLYPRGFSVSETGDIAELGAITKITDLSALSDIACAPKDLNFDMHGKAVSIQIRGLTSEEAAKLDAMEEPRPPSKPKADAQGRKIPGEDLDWENPDFRRKSQVMYETKRAIIISTGLVGVQVPGNTVESQRDWLKQKFPPHLLELLREKIMSLTSTPIEIASFS